LCGETPGAKRLTGKEELSFILITTWSGQISHKKESAKIVWKKRFVLVIVSVQFLFLKPGAKIEFELILKPNKSNFAQRQTQWDINRYYQIIEFCITKIHMVLHV